MLETVTVHPLNPWDIGRLAEAALYFPRTRWVITISQLRELIAQIGWARLHALLDLGDVDFIVNRMLLVSGPSGDQIGVGSLKPKAPPRGPDYSDVEEEIEHTMLRGLGITKANRCEVERLIPRLNLTQTEVDGKNAARLDMENDDIVTAVAAQIARDRGIPAGTYMRFRRSEGPMPGDVWQVETDFTTYSEWQEGGLAEPHRVASAIYTMCTEVDRSADGRTDLWLQPDSSSALRAKVNTIAASAQKARDDVEQFEDIVFDKLSVAQAVASGQRNIDDVIALLADPNTRKWKDWLRGQRPDARLITAYHKAVFSPNKRFSDIRSTTGRMILMTGVSVGVGIATQGGSTLVQAATALGQEAGATALERALGALTEPWRPNQWADATAKPFLGCS